MRVRFFLDYYAGFVDRAKSDKERMERERAKAKRR